MKRLLRLHSNAVWPPPLLVAIFVAPYALMAMGLWLIERTAPGMDDSEIVVVMRRIFLGLAAGIYAVFRIWQFHPACNSAYRAWLKLTPWTIGKPLPLGPVHPVWQDLAVIGLLTAVTFWPPATDHEVPVVVFGIIYLLGLTLLLARTRQWWHCLGLGFLWPALVLPEIAKMPVLAVIVMVTIVLLIGDGYRHSLRAFPWEFIPDRTASAILQADVRIDPASAAGSRFNLGWPIMALSPKAKPASVSRRRAIALAALFGWWSFCGIKACVMDPMPEFILLFAIFAALYRLTIYCSGTAAPFNVWGRIASGKLIIPGYDQVLLTPLAVVAAAILGVILVRRAGGWYPEAEGVVVAVIWLLLLAGGPTLRCWLLTGHHRLRPSKRNHAGNNSARMNLAGN